MSNYIYQIDVNRKVHVNIKVDKINKRIHVLDFHGQTSVTNSIELIQNQIINDEGLEGTFNNWTWILYGTDGSVFGYDASSVDNGFYYIGRTLKENKIIDREFYEKMEILRAIGIGRYDPYRIELMINNYDWDGWKS